MRTINKVKFVCRVCDKIFYTWARKKRKYCSQKCMGLAYEGAGNPSWMGGKNKQKYDYRFFNARLKKYVYERDQGKCQICLLSVSGKEAHRHHIDRDKQNSAPSNLVLVCIRCNAIINFNRLWYDFYFQGKDAFLYDKKTWLPKT